MTTKNRKCEPALTRLKVTVPDNIPIDQYKKRTEAVLLYPRSTINKEKDNTYSLQDEAGNKIPNIDIETIIECKEESGQTRKSTMSISYIRLEGLPENISIDEIVYYKPSTKETLKVPIK